MRSKLALLALSGSLVAAPVAFSTLVGGSGAGQQAFVVGASGAGRQAFALRASYSIPRCGGSNNYGPTGKCCRGDNDYYARVGNGGSNGTNSTGTKPTGTCCGGGGGGPNYAGVCVGDNNNSGNSGNGGNKT